MWHHNIKGSNLYGNEASALRKGSLFYGVVMVRKQISCFANCGITYHLKPYAQTGRPQPNMSTTFIGRSSPLDDVWRHIPRFALAETKKNLHSSIGLITAGTTVGCRLDGRVTGVPFSIRMQEIFPSCRTSKTSSWTHCTFYRTGTRGSFPGSKQLRWKADYRP